MTAGNFQFNIKLSRALSALVMISLPHLTWAQGSNTGLEMTIMPHQAHDLSSVVLAGQLTRPNKGIFSVRLRASCYGTNLRGVSAPLAPHSKIRMNFTANIAGKSTLFGVQFPALITTPNNPSKAAIPASDVVGVSGVKASYDNGVVLIEFPEGGQATLDETGDITLTTDTHGVSGVVFSQVEQTAVMTGTEGDFMALGGPLTSHFSSHMAPRGRMLEIAARFPGQIGFCGGYISPLMLFFDDERPMFTATSDFPLNPTGGQVYWPEAGSQGYFLGYDRSGNGKIDQGEELFGQREGKDNGFEVLKEFDSNKDGTIDKKDKAFNKLVLWNDSNADGVSQAKELKPLGSKVVSISLNYDDSEVDSFGNRAEARERSHFTFTENGKTKQGKIIDIWFEAGQQIAAPSDRD